MRGDLGDRALGEDLALMQHGDQLGDLAHEGDVVLDHHDRQAVAVQAAQDLRGLQGLFGRHAGRGLIQQEHAGPGRQHHGDLQPLQLVMG